MTNLLTISWPKRLYMIDKFSIDRNQVLQMFACAGDEYDTAIELEKHNIFKREPFEVPSDIASMFLVKKDRNAAAYAAITDKPTPLENIIKEFGVSPNVLRQVKRFDKANILKGKRLCIKTIDGVKCIFWEWK